MPKFKVSLQAIVKAAVFVECDTLEEAKTIAENAWNPTLYNAGIDPSQPKIYSYDVDTHAGKAYATDTKELF